MPSLPAVFMRKSRDQRSHTSLKFEDDESQSSSLCVSVTSTKSKSIRRSSSRCIPDPSISGRETRVRFDEKRNEKHMSAANSKCRESCWLAQEELYSLKREVALLNKKLARSNSSTECNYRRVVTCVFNVCCSVGLEIDTSNGSLICPADQADLKKCIDKSVARLGLDRITLQVIQEFARSRRALMLIKIEDFQAMASTLSKESKADLIQVAVQALSRPSRLFAREVGRAVGASCKVDNLV
mmetsp:Transcript_1639/g.2350  ORF Transcript_1639/g.2350 Transcript_1639/m.2350 type:complete len:241 (+) Transcript_1639:106-828(+)